MNFIDKILLEAVEDKLSSTDPKSIIWYFENKVYNITTKKEKDWLLSRGYKREYTIYVSLCKGLRDLEKAKDVYVKMMHYTGTFYARTNNALRGGKSSPVAETIDTYLRFAPKTKQDVLYRGVGREYFDSLEKVKKFTDPGFVSTTTDLSTAVHFSKKKRKGGVLEIHGCAGLGTTVPLPIGLGDDYGEDEFILPRGTTFKILSREPGKIICQIA